MSDYFLIMKRFSLLILLSIALSGCSSPQPFTTPISFPITATKSFITPTTTAISPVDNAEIIEFLPNKYVELLGDYPSLISPNGKEIALELPSLEINEQASTLMPLIPIKNKEFANNLEIQLDRAHTYYYFDSWSPDSTAFVGVFYDADKFSGGDFCCGEAITITNLQEGKAKTSIYSWDWNFATSIRWSNDSSMVSVNFSTDKYPTLVIDRYGKLITTLSTGEKAAFWSRDILYYTIQKEGKVELQSVDFDTHESNLVIDDIGEKHFVAQNEKSNEILLTEVIGDINSATNIFYILDLDTKTITEITNPNVSTARAWHWASSPSHEFVAISVYAKWEENNLRIFDWKKHEIMDYGRIKHLYGWYENINGFLVTSLDGKQKIIKP